MAQDFASAIPKSDPPMLSVSPTRDNSTSRKRSRTDSQSELAENALSDAWSSSAMAELDQLDQLANESAADDDDDEPDDEQDASEDDDDDYEKKRLETIKRNRQMLTMLGLGPSTIVMENPQA